MYNRVISFIGKHNVLYPYQFGFKKQHSTYMAITIMLEQITKALDNNKHVIAVYLDFAKAFDTVDHDLLMLKLSHYGIRGKALKWFKSYMSERQQI